MPEVPRRPLVLLVENDEVFLETCARELRRTGFEVIAAGGAESAFRLALAASPDAIVTELALRPHDGWTLLRELKRDVLTRNIPVVLLTTCDGPDSCYELVKQAQGASCLVKPCPPEVIALELACVLANRAT